MNKDADGNTNAAKKVFTYESERYSGEIVTASDDFYLDSTGRILRDPVKASPKLSLEFDAAGNIVRVVLTFDPGQREKG